MAKTVATILGALFLIIGLLGFVAPNLLGMHLNVTHNFVHIISGALALYFGLAGTLPAARTFCIVFGVVYGLLGLFGFFFGDPNNMLTVIPGQLVLGTADHVIHLLLGAIFLVAGLATRTTVAHAEQRH